MFLIANNINTRDARVRAIFQQAERLNWETGGKPARTLSELAEKCQSAGANALEINIQQHYDRPEAMEFAVNALQQGTDLPLCLSTDNTGALEAGLRGCKHSPLVNYISMDETRLKKMLPVAGQYQSGAVLLVSDPAVPNDAREMLQKAAILIGAANEAGIPGERILVDPGLIHVTGDAGQRHLVEVIEFIRALPDAVETPVKSTCWLGNSSAGAPDKLRPAIETSLLLMLAGAGLSSVFLNVLKPENRRVVRLIRIFNNETIYSDSEVEP